jgi:hypothetical protein
MDNNHPDREQVRLADIVKRGIAIADANFGFIIIFFVVYFLTWFGMDSVRAHFVGSGETVETDVSRLIVIQLYLHAASIPINALIYSLIGAVLRRRLVSPQSDSDVSVLAWVRKFFLRMLSIAAIQAFLIFPLGALLYVPLMYVAAFVIWQNCRVRKAFSDTTRFLSAHSGKFFPVWFVGVAFVLWVNKTASAPVGTNPVFTGLVCLIWTYFDFAMLATALVFFLRLQPKGQEVLA